MPSRRWPKARGHRFIDLFDLTEDYDKAFHDPARGLTTRLTDDGIHPTGFGYYFIARIQAHEIDSRRLFANGNEVRIGHDGQVEGAKRAEVTRVEPSPAGLRFTLSAETLPTPVLPPTITSSLLPVSSSSRACRRGDTP